jgi:uncharacterized membrane protein
MRPSLLRLLGDERGQVLAPAALLLVGVVAVVGLTVDGGLLFAERRALQNLADGAALAGAMQVDEDAYRASGGETMQLDEDAAYQAAAGYLSDRGVEYAVVARVDRVEVAVTGEASTSFLRVLRIEGVKISAEAVAEPRFGIAEAGE